MNQDLAKVAGVKRFHNYVTRTKQLERQAAADAFDFQVVRGEELSPAMLAKAKKLHAEIYLERSFINPIDVGPEGFMHVSSDPHQQHSDYFIVVDRRKPDEVLATVRQIRASTEHKQLPIIEQAKLYTRGKNAILQVDPQYIVEISGLAKAHGTPSTAVLELYLAMWGDSMKDGHRLWLMACDVRLYRRLKILFGKSISRVGRRTHYKGGDVIPCKLELSESHVKLLKNLNSKHPIYGRARKAMAKKFLRAYSQMDLL